MNFYDVSKSGPHIERCQKPPRPSADCKFTRSPGGQACTCGSRAHPSRLTGLHRGFRACSYGTTECKRQGCSHYRLNTLIPGPGSPPTLTLIYLPQAHPPLNHNPGVKTYLRIIKHERASFSTRRARGPYCRGPYVTKNHPPFIFFSTFYVDLGAIIYSRIWGCFRRGGF
jgi:hypothetical protein